jgi:arylsulfatase A-like enzyme
VDKVSLTKMHDDFSRQRSLTGRLLVVAIWFGTVTGTVEGAGLLVFQRLNSGSWGAMMHVSGEILWISPLVDVCFFVTLALLVSLPAQIGIRFPAIRTMVFLLTFLAVYDWLTLTDRLRHSSCLILALGVSVAFNRWFGKRRDKALRFWTRTAPWAAAGFALLLTGIQGGSWLWERTEVAKLPPPQPESPNVLVVVMDTLRADHLSCYGYTLATSPNIDRLAAQGVLFENAIAPSSWSLPSHVSLVTGRYQFEHGVDNVRPAPWLGWGNKGLGGYPTLGEGLLRKGYRTGAFSANRTYFTANLGFGRGFLHFEDYFHSLADMFIRTLYGREFSRIYLNRSDKSKVKRALRFLGMNSLLDKDSEGSVAHGGAQAVRKRGNVVNEEAIRWIERDTTRPFFVFLNYFDVHDPYGAPGETPGLGRIAEYDSGVRYVDEQIGRLLQTLEAEHRLQNTLVIVTSDHGESLGQHGLLYHAQALYWELIHVPLIVWFPGHVPAGTRITTPVTNAAIAATVMDVLGKNGENRFPGPSLKTFWNDGGTGPDPLSEIAKTDVMGTEDKAAGKLVPTARDGAMKSLVTPRWHLITHEKLGNQLYDWTQDPGETHDLTNTPEGQNVARGLLLELQATVTARLRPSAP